MSENDSTSMAHTLCSSSGEDSKDLHSLPRDANIDNDKMDRDDLLEAFLTVLNICEPDHPYTDDPYPVSRSDVDYGYKKESSNVWASCGPKYVGYSKTVIYKVDKAYMNRVSTERHLAVLTHEVTHVTENSGTEGSTHNPAFWKEMMFNAWQLRESWDEIQQVFENPDKEQFITEVIEDPNKSMVDRRMETVRERKQENAELMGRDGL